MRFKKYINEKLKKSQYEIYHETYSSAIDSALDYLKRNGYTHDEEEAADIIGLQSYKPMRGKTTKISLPIYKNGKLQRKALQIQVYNRGTETKTFELNAYIL